MIPFTVEKTESGWTLTSAEGTSLFALADDLLAEIHKRVLAAEPSNEQTTGQ